MIGKLDDYMRFNETALSLRSTRQELLASNIANADTPNYKARDVDFASALKGAMARKDGVPPALKGTAPQHLPGKGVAAAAGAARAARSRPWPTARRCCTARRPRAPSMAIRWTWISNATPLPTTPSATRRP